MPDRQRIGDSERRLAAVLPFAVRDVRLALRLTQSKLAARSGLSQSQISRFERGGLEWLTVREIGRLLDALGIEIELAARQPNIMATPHQHDRRHAAAVAYVARRLSRASWDVRLEVEVIDGRSRGWIDVLAYRPSSSALLVIEVKSALNDVGAAVRQLAWHDRLAPAVARRLGWSVTSRASALLALATNDNDSLVTANHSLIRRSFPSRARELWTWLADPSGALMPTIALIDPSSRRQRWLVPCRLDGRRTPLQGRR